MEVTALCFSLLTVMILLCEQDPKVDAASLLIDPNKVQFFEYESVTFHCEGGFSYEAVRKHNATTRLCSSPERTPTGSSCTIKNVYSDDSGEHWCEDEAGERSNSINITVTAGPVILESPALPVTEEDDVTLSCRKKNMSSNLPADFFKDGVFIRSSSTGNLAIHRVSTSNEGLYRCRISGSGESPQSRLTVTGQQDTSSPSTSSSSTPWVVVTILLAILLLVLGLLHFGKGYLDRVLRYLSTLTPGTGTAEDQTVSTRANAAETNNVIYAAVKKDKKKKDMSELSSNPIYYTLGDDDAQQLEPGRSSIAALTEDAFYSAIK